VIGTAQARATVTVDLGAIEDNVARLRHAAGQAEVWAVVKADGYGHGATAVGRAAMRAGARRLCVATWEEARALRWSDVTARTILVERAAAGASIQSRQMWLPKVDVSLRVGVFRRNGDAFALSAVVAGVGGWAGAVVAGKLDTRDPTAALGFVNAVKDLTTKTTAGGMLYVFALPH